jgi:peptidylprolyl isomerase
MNKTYSAVIVVLVIIVALLSISLFNQRDGQVVQKTNLTEEDNIENMDENTNDKQEVLEKVEQENGLIIEVIEKADGAIAEPGKTVAVHYTGKLEDGTVFDSSIQRGTPIEFPLGAGRVIRGWDEGILGMNVGEKRVLTIPASLGYGDQGVTLPDGTVLIPGGATLIFDVELVDVK